MRNKSLLQLRVSRHDDTPAPHEKIQLCVRVRGKDEWLRVVVECRNFTSSSDGFVDFVVPPPHRNIVLLSFVATGIDYPTKYYSPDTRWRVSQATVIYFKKRITNFPRAYTGCFIFIRLFLNDLFNLFIRRFILKDKIELIIFE